MKSVLTVLGISVLVLILAMVFGRKASLTPTPADDAEMKRQFYERRDAAEAAKKKPLDLGKAASASANSTSNGAKDAAKPSASAAGASQPNATPAKDDPIVSLNVQNRGTISIELFKKDAPKTVDHFLGLVNHKFYEGILFHRVRPGFVVQAGDPKSRSFSAHQLVGKSDEETGAMGLGGGGSGPNGANNPTPFERNNRTHEAGTVALALSSPRSDTGDSQFFINLAPNHTLDGDYCVFGQVVKGMDVVSKLQQGDKIVSIVAAKR